jgi:rhamnosyltransferase
MSRPSVSVFMPVRNEASKIGACLDGILSQTIPVNEVIVVDSGSTDNTVAIARTFDAVKVVEIPPEEFNHGGTRALGPMHATGEAILYTVGDARPADDRWIEKMLSPIIEDGSVMAVCGAQVVPHEKDKNPVEWFRPQTEPKVSVYQFADLGEFQNLPPEQKRAVCGWDDVSALYRRDALECVPFEPITYGEDMDWICRAIGAGVKFAYNPAARVYHYHQIDRDFARKQTFATLYHRYRLFGLRATVPAVLSNLMSNARLLFREAGLSWSERGRWLAYNLSVTRGVRDAVRLFDGALARSESELDGVYQEICGKPPIPVKN